MRISQDDDSWKAGGIKRRDFRHTHDGPEVPKFAGAKKKKFKKCKGKGAHDWVEKTEVFSSCRECTICGKRKDHKFDWKKFREYKEKGR